MAKKKIKKINKNKQKKSFLSIYSFGIIVVIVALIVVFFVSNIAVQSPNKALSNQTKVYVPYINILPQYSGNVSSYLVVSSPNSTFKLDPGSTENLTITFQLSSGAKTPVGFLLNNISLETKGFLILSESESLPFKMQFNSTNINSSSLPGPGNGSGTGPGHGSGTGPGTGPGKNGAIKKIYLTIKLPESAYHGPLNITMSLGVLK